MKDIITGILAALVLGLVINAVVNSGRDTPRVTPSTAATPVTIDITATDLHAAYTANEIAADQKYKGKTLRVSGEIADIGKDILATPYVVLDRARHEINRVQFMFPKKRLNRRSRTSLKARTSPSSASAAGSSATSSCVSRGSTERASCPSCYRACES